MIKNINIKYKQKKCNEFYRVGSLSYLGPSALVSFPIKAILLASSSCDRKIRGSIIKKY